MSLQQRDRVGKVGKLMRIRHLILSIYIKAQAYWQKVLDNDNLI